MPVIVYKSMDVSVVWVQARTIRCQGCKERFVYIASGSTTARTTGLPIFSSDEGMREEISKQIQKACEAIQFKPRQGEALCPHCKRYQSWMVSANRQSRGGWGFGCGGALGAVAGGALYFYIGERTAPWWLWIAGAVLFAAAGVAYGLKTALAEGPHPQLSDARGMKEPEFDEFVIAAQEKELEPTLAWWAMIGGKFEDKVPVIPLKPYEDE